VLKVWSMRFLSVLIYHRFAQIQAAKDLSIHLEGKNTAPARSTASSDFIRRRAGWSIYDG
jgi:hypothetical protein